MNRTSIEWTDYTWNPVTGCHKIARGCRSCYAETMTRRFAKTWGVSGFREIRLHYDRLNEPFAEGSKLRGKKVFVCDMSDLFHEEVPFAFIDQVFAITQQFPDTVFQILTKRVKRMREYFEDARVRLMPDGDRPHEEAYCKLMRNLWIGFSASTQKEYNANIENLDEIRAFTTFVSLEPLVGPINLKRHYTRWLPPDRDHDGNTLVCTSDYHGVSVDWVIVGGESGNSSLVQPMHPDWVRSLRDQCAQNKVAFFFKQWGSHIPYERADKVYNLWRSAQTLALFDGDSDDFIKAARDAQIFYRKRSKAMCGNFLDGVQYMQFPKVT